MTKSEALDLRKFRTLTGPARRVAVREYLQSQGVEFGQDVDTLSVSAKCLIANMAKACGYRKPIGCPFSLGASYYRYLNRGL